MLIFCLKKVSKNKYFLTNQGRNFSVIVSDSETIQLIFTLTQISNFRTLKLKFYPVLDLLHAHSVSLFALTCIPLNLFAIRTRFAPSVRKSVLPSKGRGIALRNFLLTYLRTSLLRNDLSALVP